MRAVVIVIGAHIIVLLTYAPVRNSNGCVQW